MDTPSTRISQCALGTGKPAKTPSPRLSSNFLGRSNDLQHALTFRSSERAPRAA
jgi:hypothetical protein